MGKFFFLYFFFLNLIFRKQKTESPATVALAELMETSIPQTTDLFNRMYRRTPTTGSGGSNGAKSQNVKKKVRHEKYFHNKYQFFKIFHCLMVSCNSFKRVAFAFFLFFFWTYYIFFCQISILLLFLYLLDNFIPADKMKLSSWCWESLLLRVLF